MRLSAIPIDRSHESRCRRIVHRVGPMILAMLLGWLASPLAVAQVPVRLPDGAVADRSKLVIQLGRDGEPLPIRVLYSGLKARVRPEPLGRDNPVRGEDLGYLSAYYSAMESVPAGEGGKYYLIVSRREGSRKVQDVIGWVHSRYLLATNHALQDPVNRIYQKAIVVNSIADIVEDFKRIQGDPDARFGAVTPRTAPSTTGPTTGEEIRLFSFFFVYGQTDGYTLLGRSPILPDGDDETNDIIVGWVPKNRVYEWRTREAIYWNPSPSRDLPGVIFETAQDATKTLNGEKGTIFSSEVAIDPKGQVFGRKLGAIQMRFPVLEWENDPNIRRKQRNNEMIRIGAFGDFFNAGAAGPIRGGLTEKDLADLQSQLLELQRESSKLELAFVIDETLSMKIWFPTVVQTINAIINQVNPASNRGRDINVRISISYYADTYRGANPATPGRLLPIKSPAFTQTLQELSTHREIDGEDLDERLFYGLGQAIDHAGFSDKAHKMVFLFGDFGNKHVAGDPKFEDLFDKLVPVNSRINPIEFYAVQMGKVAGDPDVVESAGKFKTDMRNLSKRVDDAIKKRRPRDLEKKPDDPKVDEFRSFTTVVDLQDATPMISQVVDRFMDLHRRATRIADDIDRQRLTFGNPVSAEIERTLQIKGVPIDLLRKPGEAQLFQAGYVWVKNAKGVKQVRPYLLINDQEINDFLDITTGLDKLPEAAGSVTLAAFIERVTGHQLGELGKTEKEMTANELLQKYRGYRISQPSFDIKIKDLKPKTLNAQERASIGLKRSNLSGLRNPKTPAEARGFHFPGDSRTKWYWIDSEEEWP